MAAIKAYTDLSQSKTLSKILPLESADMYYCYGMDIHTKKCGYDIIPTIIDSDNQIDICDIPCWSLANLLEQLPYELCDDNGNSTYLSLNKDDDEYQLIYSDRYGYFDNIETEPYGDFVDACVEMIEKLNELNLL